MARAISPNRSAERFGVWVAASLIGSSMLATASDVARATTSVAARGYLDGLAVVETERGPRQRPGALLDTQVDVVARSWLRGHADWRARIGGPFEGGHQGIYNFVHAFQNRSPSLELSEMFADIRSRDADFRIGIQKFDWGKLDGVPPTDVLNPRDYHDPFVAALEEAKIGVPAVEVTYYLPEAPSLALTQPRATLVYVPIAVPSRLPLLEERWFPSTALPGSRLTLSRDRVDQALTSTTRKLCREKGTPCDMIEAGFSGTGDLVVPLAVRTLNHRAPLRLDAGGIAGRVAGTWRAVDWAIYHYTGPETAPDADVRAQVRGSVCLLVGGKRICGRQLLDFDPRVIKGFTSLVFDLSLHSTAALRQAHDTIHMTGCDAAAVIGGATVRTEAAFLQDRPYLRLARDLVSPSALRGLPLSTIGLNLLKHGRAAVPVGELFPTVDAVEWGIGVDYLIRGFLPLLQVNQTVLLGAAPRLVINDPETRLTASVSRRFIQERLEVEVRGVYALERQAWFVFPRASYMLRDNLRLRVGYLALGGPLASIIGQFRRNDECVLDVRYSF